MTEAQLRAQQARTKRVGQLTMLVGAFVMPAMVLPALLLGSLTSAGNARDPVTVLWAFGLFLPINYLRVRINAREQGKGERLVGALTERLSETLENADRNAVQRELQARRQEFESRLANALEMAEGEPEVMDVIERSLSATLPDAPVEFLLADHSHAHLLRMATVSPDGKPPGCGVDSPDHCPAARRAQIQHFDHSETLDACPKLRGRTGGPVSATCVPVSVMGRTVGVIHATGEPNGSFSQAATRDLGTLASLAGARIGLLRMMAETQVQAATDSLTGLLNRRSFERRLPALRRDGTVLAIAMADLDRFKELNDTHGHDTGDRALRLFTKVLSESVRAQDLVCRHGGEEFVIALPECTATKARQIFDAVRARLDAAITVAGMPSFTVTVGVVDTYDQEDLPSLTARADAALFQAKREGRDQVIVHDTAGLTVPTSTDPDLDLDLASATPWDRDR